ncbi:MAG: nitroreductase family protein [Desulfobacterales bacterium]|jgi:nitroreductase/NAD-dependent dihydropyrimidine dehydrogenase PreA subunit
MNLFEVNKDTCNQDGICAAICPTGIIEMQKGAYPAPTAEAEDICIRCGHCVAVCPTASFSHREMSMEKCPPIQKELHLSPEQCEQFLRARRSIRTYKKQSVPKNELLKLIHLARFAPTGHNSQSVEWLVMGNRDELKQLAGITVDWMRWMLDNMSEIALFLHMDRAILRWEEGKDVILRDAPAVIVTHAAKEDLMAPTASTIALSYLELAATSMGLGCCWAGYFHAAATTFPPMIEALPLPEGHQCTGSMMVGYPRFSYHRLPLRKQPEIIWRL